jgi:hypothetical protein
MFQYQNAIRLFINVKTCRYSVRFQVLMAVSMNMTVFWDVTRVVWSKFTDVSYSSP